MVAIALSMLYSAPAESQPVRGGYIYTLSSFTGSIPYNWSRVTVDRERNEIYVLYQNNVSIFNQSGMEVYRFGDDIDLGHVVDIALDEDGDILLLIYQDSRSAIIRCN
jgi:hypothetical protein